MRHVLHLFDYADKDQQLVGTPDPLIVGPAGLDLGPEEEVVPVFPPAVNTSQQPTGYQRPRRVDSTPSAATPAVEVRSTARPEPDRRRRRPPRTRRVRRRRSRPPGRPPARSPGAGSSAVVSRSSPPRAARTPAAARRAGRHRRGRLVRRAADHRQPRPARLLGRLPGGRPPLVAGPVAPVTAPLRHRAGRRPGHDLVDADLGHRLHGQLAPVALGDALHDDQPRIGRGHVPPAADGEVDAAPPDGGDLGGGACRPRPSASISCLAGPQPLHGGGVMPFGAVERSARPRRAAPRPETAARTPQA